MPWAAELGCRCGALNPARGSTWLWASVAVAACIDVFFIACEVSLLLQGRSAAMLNASSQPQLSDCLPGNAILGGQFRLDKADLEATGRAVFVPAQTRQGLYVGAGLGLLSHLIFGIILAGSAVTNVPWLLLGSSTAFTLRRVSTEVPHPKGPVAQGALWKREGPRLLLRFGELFWLWCCVTQLTACEASDAWLPACVA
mmetsp:Transcript_41388/g.92971  ORF Transcript_41388/g.92971 Transcript_41388/m.92971 type:complete len:199 (+) Transcript_41388:2-598(+)